MYPDDLPTGDVPSMPSAGDNPTAVADHVVATYVAEAVRSIAGIAELHGSTWQELSERVRVDVHAKGIVVHTVAPGVIEVDAHVRVAWGVRIPDIARAFQAAVRTTISSLLDLDVRRATLFVDAIDPPPELS